MTETTLNITLSSGETTSISAVTLFRQRPLAEARYYAASAAKALGASGPMLGVMGTPNMGFAAELGALTLLSGFAAVIARNAATEHTKKAKECYLEAQASAQMFAIRAVKWIDRPDPSQWLAEGESEDQLMDMSNMTKEEKKEFVAQHGLEHLWGMSDRINVKIPVRYTHDGGEFILVESSEGPQHIRWSSVARFRKVEIAN